MIYLAKNSYEKFKSLRNLSYYDKDFKSPEDFLYPLSRIALLPDSVEFESPSVSVKMLDRFEGPILAGSANIYSQELSILKFWNESPRIQISHDILFYQNPYQEYFVEEREKGDYKLITEGNIVEILLPRIRPETEYLEFAFEISEKFYEFHLREEIENSKLVFYLKTEEILKSPNPRRILLELVHNFTLDYGYYY